MAMAVSYVLLGVPQGLGAVTIKRIERGAEEYLAENADETKSGGGSHLKSTT